MIPALAVLICSLALIGEHVEKDGACIDVSLQAQTYEWSVSNLSTDPIMRFEIVAHNTYSQKVPDGWEWELDGDRFICWTEDRRSAIRPGKKKTFSASVGSQGASVGLVSATIGLAGGDKTIAISEVWGPVAKPRSIIAVIAVTLISIALLHTLFLMYRGRKKAKA